MSENGRISLGLLYYQDKPRVGDVIFSKSTIIVLLTDTFWEIKLIDLHRGSHEAVFSDLYYVVRSSVVMRDGEVIIRGEDI